MAGHPVGHTSTRTFRGASARSTEHFLGKEEAKAPGRPRLDPRGRNRVRQAQPHCVAYSCNELYAHPYHCAIVILLFGMITNKNNVLEANYGRPCISASRRPNMRVEYAGGAQKASIIPPRRLRSARLLMIEV